MKKTIFTILLVLFTLNTIAAVPDSIRRNLEDYDYLVSFTEKNYAPFSAIMEKGYQREYNAMKKQLRQQIKQGEVDIEKAAIDYVLWYYGRFDRHIMVNTKAFRETSNTMLSPKDIEIIEYAPKAVSCKVDSCTWLIRVTSCDASLEKWTSDAFWQFLKSGCEHLIIDLRGNLGGSDGVWNSYYLALYDHPSKPCIYWFRNTPENLHHWDPMLDSSSSEYVREFVERCKTSKKKFEKWVEKTGDMGLQPSTLIQRAAVLIDWNTASAAESLVGFVKKYSDRAKVYGVGNTFGANQSGNCHYVVLPNSKIGFQYATTVTSDFYDNDFSGKLGIAPDIIIPLPYATTLTDNIDEWVLWVAEDLKR